LLRSSMNRLGLVILAIGLANCANTVTPLFPVSEGDIIDRPYTPVADVNSQVFFGGIFDEGTPEEMCLAKMKQEVVSQRGDALIFVRHGEKGYDLLLRRALRCSGRVVRFDTR